MSENGDISVLGYGKNRRSKTCYHCNEQIEDHAMKCKYCGSAVSRTDQKQKTYYSGGEDSGMGCALLLPLLLLFVATFFIPLVGLIVGGIFAFNDDVGKRTLGVMLLAFGIIMILFRVL